MNDGTLQECLSLNNVILTFPNGVYLRLTVRTTLCETSGPQTATKDFWKRFWKLQGFRGDINDASDDEPKGVIFPVLGKIRKIKSKIQATEITKVFRI